MGVDRRGRERGKCTLCDCTEFEEGEGLGCAYCGDPPAKHVLILDVNNNADKGHTPLHEQETHETEGSNETESERPWEDPRLGWIPGAKRATGIFYNEVLKNFYQSYWPYHPHLHSFRKAFISERSRQWDIKKQLDNITQKIAFLRSLNEASAGRYLSEFVPKRSDAANIERLMECFQSVQNLLSELYETVSKQDDTLFCSNSRRMKSGRAACHAFNEDIMEKIRSVKNEVNQLMDLLVNANDIVSKVVNKKQIRSEKQKRRENRWKVKKRAQLAQKHRCTQIFQILGGEPCGLAITPAEGVFQITTIPDTEESFLTKLNTRDRSCLSYMIESGCFRGDALDFVSSFI